MRLPDVEFSTDLFDHDAWRHFSHYLQGRVPALLLNSSIAAAQSLLVLPVLYLIRYTFDEAIPAGDAGLLIAIGAGIILIRAVESGIALGLRFANLKIIKGAVRDMRHDIVARLYDLSRDFHSRSDRNQLHARVVIDTERVDTMCDALISRLMPACFTSLALVLVLLFLNWILLLVMVALVPIILFGIYKMGKVVKRRVYAFQRAFESFSKGVAFLLEHMDLTRIQAFEGKELETQGRYVNELRSTGERMTFAFAFQGQMQRSATGVAAIVVLVVGGIAVANATMSVGELLSFFVAAGQLNQHANNIAGALPAIITGNESMATLHAIAASEETRPYSGTRRIDYKGHSELRGVYFGYGEKPVLRNANLKIEPGSTIAIVGPNGAGKTTVLHLLLGFYRPTSGSVLAEGISYDELDINLLRRRIGVVPQQPSLFAGTLEENIAYGWPEATREDVVEASRLALAHEFVSLLPNGYDTQVGQSGVLLAGGERQRLAIARSLLGHPALLVLDEPTNHLDRSAVTRLMGSLDQMENRPAILMITHDLNIIEHCDVVYELVDGTLELKSESAG